MKSLKSCNSGSGGGGQSQNVGNLKDKLETIRRNKILLEEKIREYEKKLGK